MAAEKGKSSKSAPVFSAVGEAGKGIYGMVFKTAYTINDWLVPVMEKCIGN